VAAARPLVANSFDSMAIGEPAGGSGFPCGTGIDAELLLASRAAQRVS